MSPGKRAGDPTGRDLVAAETALVPCGGKAPVQLGPEGRMYIIRQDSQERTLRFLVSVEVHYVKLCISVFVLYIVIDNYF